MPLELLHLRVRLSWNNGGVFSANLHQTVLMTEHSEEHGEECTKLLSDDCKPS